MDTALRLLNPKFYQHSHDNLEAALHTIKDHTCYFLVAARKFDGHLHTIHELHVKSVLLDLFEEIPVADFQLDISSTHIRNSNSQNQSS
jgi:hypothetical protein